MGRTGLLSHRVKFLQCINPVSLIVEVILEKHYHTESRGSAPSAEGVGGRIHLCTAGQEGEDTGHKSRVPWETGGV